MGLRSWVSSKLGTNKYNLAFFKTIWKEVTPYDANAKTYIQKGYNINPLVYSVVNQIATKASSVPFYIKKVDDKREKSKRDALVKATNYNFSPQQYFKKLVYESKAFKTDYLDIPLDRPNPLHTWTEFIALYEVFLNASLGVYIYLLSPENGENKGQPIAWYLLPSHLMKIVLKDDVDLLSIESPVKEYMLIEGNQQVTFPAKDIIHIKFANPNFDSNGSHLYGQSPLRAALKNIQSSNEALDLNNKTLRNGGAYGFIHSKGQNGLTEKQAKAIKEDLKEMDASPDRLSKIAGTNAEIGFARISLTTDELKPFDYLNFDLKQICNVFGWDDKLLGNDGGSKYDNYLLAQKRCTVGKVLPDLKMLEEAINSQILPRYKNYKGAVWEFDVSELPEMQEDMEKLINWAVTMKKEGSMTGNEMRVLAKLPKSDNPLMDEFTVNTDIMTLEQALENYPQVQ